MNSASSTKAAAPGLFFLLIWTTVTGAFDGIALGGIAWQMLSWRYAATAGTILKSRTLLGKDDGHTTYTVDVKYRYQVGGKAFEGNRIRYFDLSFHHDDTQAEETQRRFAAGKQVPVYYDPIRPQEAVLERNLRGRDFFLPLFLNPFNVIMLGGWWMLLRGRRKGKMPAGMKIRDDGLRVVARFYNVTPLAAAAGAVLITSFLLTFVCAFGMTVLPVDWLVTGAWMIVLGAAAGVWWRFRNPATTLEYDQFSGRVSIATHDGQSHALTNSDIVALGAEDPDDKPEHAEEDDERDQSEPAAEGSENSTAESREMEPLSSGENECVPTVAPTLTYRDAQGKGRTVRLAAWSSGDDAQWLARWLRETMRLKV